MKDLVWATAGVCGVMLSALAVRENHTTHDAVGVTPRGSAISRSGSFKRVLDRGREGASVH